MRAALLDFLSSKFKQGNSRHRVLHWKTIMVIAHTYCLVGQRDKVLGIQVLRGRASRMERIPNLYLKLQWSC